MQQFGLPVPGVHRVHYCGNVIKRLTGSASLSRGVTALRMARAATAAIFEASEVAVAPAPPAFNVSVHIGAMEPFGYLDPLIG